MKNNFLGYIFDRLCFSDLGEAFFNADEVIDWPSDALDMLIKLGLLRPAQPAKYLECLGCEQNCVRPVEIFPSEGKLPARAFIFCENREDINQILVNFKRLERWQITGDLVAAVVAKLLGVNQLSDSMNDKQWNIGVLKGTGINRSPVTLLLENNLTLSLAGHTISLIEVLDFQDNTLAINKRKLIQLVNKPIEYDKLHNKKVIDQTIEKKLGGKNPKIGSSAWRKQNAKKAADAKHNKPGGNREKQQRIREIWATGKYSSRDRCAEEECAGLGMSFKSARNALVNIPKSKDLPSAK